MEKFRQKNLNVILSKKIMNEAYYRGNDSSYMFSTDVYFISGFKILEYNDIRLELINLFINPVKITSHYIKIKHKMYLKLLYSVSYHNSSSRYNIEYLQSLIM